MKTNNRTICLRVAEVVNGEKQEFYADLRETLHLSRRIYNMGLSECVAQDRESYTVDGEIPKKGKVGTYATIVKGKSFAAGFTKELANVLKSAESKYSEKRFDILRGKCSLPTARSHPWPLLNNKSVKRMSWEHRDGNLYVKFRLIGKKWTVRVKSGSNYKDQIKGVLGAIKVGDSKIWIDRKGVAVVGFACEIEAKTPVVDPSKTLVVRTMPDALLAIVRERSDTPYMISGELAKQKQAIKNGLQKKLRQDIKPGQKRQVRRKLSEFSDKWFRWCDTYIHEVTAQIVSFAIRGKYGKIELDDAIRSFLPSFPWHDLKTKLAYKCADQSIEFVHNPTIAFEPCEVFDKPTPHIYFAVELDREGGKQTGKIKIGKTKRTTHERMKEIPGETNNEYIPIAVYESKKPRLSKDETMFHSIFADHRVTKDRELFRLEPIKTWLRERGAIEGPSDPVAISRPKDSEVSTDA